MDFMILFHKDFLISIFFTQYFIHYDSVYVFLQNTTMDFEKFKVRLFLKQNSVMLSTYPLRGIFFSCLNFDINNLMTCLNVMTCLNYDDAVHMYVYCVCLWKVIQLFPFVIYIYVIPYIFRSIFNTLFFSIYLIPS